MRACFPLFKPLAGSMSRANIAVGAPGAAGKTVTADRLFDHHSHEER
jgi:hypothetical protein